MRNITTTAICVLILFTTAVFGISGSGIETDPLLIRSLTDFNDLAADSNYWDDHIRLEIDLNLAGKRYNDAVIGYGIEFTGTFDGNDQKISNLTIDVNNFGSEPVGLFGTVGSAAVIKNLGVEDCNIICGEDSSGVGTLIGDSLGGNINNCYSTGQVKANTNSAGIGGLIGSNDGDVNDCYSNCNVNSARGSYCIGGLIGFNGYGLITNCYSVQNNISSHTSDSMFIGGLIGYNNYGNINNCFSDSNLIGCSYIGGLVGFNNYQTDNGILENCQASGTIFGGQLLGGLAGSNDGIITKCQSFGTVTGKTGSYYVGGLAGSNNHLIQNCYASGNVTGHNYTGGLVGRNYVDADINDCYAVCDVNGGEETGGLAGYNDTYCTINNSYSQCNIIIPDGSDYIGGLVGDNRAEISRCYANGTITNNIDSGFIGGLVGYNSSGSIYNCYTTVALGGGGFVGGLVGVNVSGSYHKSFWNTDINPSLTGIGANQSDPNLIGKNTTEMKSAELYVNNGWQVKYGYSDNEANYWRLCYQSNVYPRLIWEFSDSDFACPDGVDFIDFSLLANSWLSADGDLNFYEETDLTGDNTTNISDLALFVAEWLDNI